MRNTVFNSISGIIFIIISIIALFILGLVSKISPLTVENTLTFRIGIASWLNQSEFTARIVPFIITILTAIVIYVMERKAGLYEKEGFQTLVAYILFMNAGAIVQRFSEAHLANFFILIPLAFYQSTLSAKDHVRTFFFLTLLLSIGALISPPLIFYIPLFWIRGIFLRSYNFKAFLASILGFIIPHIYIGAVSFILKGTVPPLFETLQTIFNLKDFSELPDGLPIYAGILVFLTIASVGIIIREKIHFQINADFFLVNTIWLLVPPLVLSATRIIKLEEALVLMAVPMSFLLKGLFIFTKRFYSNLYLIILISGILIAFIQNF